MAQERVQRQGGRFFAASSDAHLAITSKTPVSAPNVTVQSRNSVSLRGGHEYCAKLVTDMRAKWGAMQEARYKTSGVLALVPSFDLLRPRG